MSQRTRRHTLLFITVVCTSLLQMPFMALNPVIEYIQKDVFPDRSLTEVQTAISSLNLFVMLFALLAALLVAKRVMSKKAVVVTGLVIYGATGIAAILLHSRFWNLWLLSVLIGSGSGLYISTLTSVLYDCLDKEDLRLATGLQASSVNIGGIAFGALGGVLATAVWYGGYLLELVGLPVALLTAFAIPSQKALRSSPEAVTAVKKKRIPADVYYFALATFIFFMLYSSCGLNISTHLANGGFGSPATAGFASAVQMAGGVAAGLLFGKLSSKLKDLMLPAAFAALFIGFTMLNLGRAVLALNLAGVFIAGVSLSMLFPYCIFSASKYVDETNSATAASLVQAMAPGLGGFVSPIILTNLTAAFYPAAQMHLRYQLLGFITLALGALFFAANRLRARAGCR